MGIQPIALVVASGVVLSGRVARVSWQLPILLLGLLLVGCGRPSVEESPRDEPAAGALTEEERSVLRTLRFWWLPIESGAVAIDLASSFGEEEGAALVGHLAGGPPPSGPWAEALVDLYPRETPGRALARLFERLLRDAALEPGAYDVTSTSPPRAGFELTDRHLALLRGATIDERHLAGIGIDGKRPYGDFTYYFFDIARILGEHDVPGEATGTRPPLPAPVQEAYEQLHRETLWAVGALAEHGE